jgi:7-cyano-7-deazaguanine synthase
MPPTAFVALSGGMDSTAALTRAVRLAAESGSAVEAIGVDYGQRHAKELIHATLVADALGVPFRTRSLVGTLAGSSLLGEGSVPHGHYAEESMKATVVPGRNLAFIATLVALAAPGDQVWIGVHSGDHFIYPDCRASFIEPLSTAIWSAYEVALIAPWLWVDKAGIVTQEPSAPFALSWSCYEGGEIHCGRCGTCVERAEAFSLAGVTDPTTYADPDFWRTAKAPA